MRAGEARVGRRVTTLPPPRETPTRRLHTGENVSYARHKKNYRAQRWWAHFVDSRFRRQQDEQRHTDMRAKLRRHRASSSQHIPKAGRRRKEPCGGQVRKPTTRPTEVGHRSNGEPNRKPETDIGRTGSPPGNQRRTSGERGVHPETKDGHRANGESTRKPKTAEKCIAACRAAEKCVAAGKSWDGGSQGSGPRKCTSRPIKESEETSLLT